MSMNLRIWGSSSTRRIRAADAPGLDSLGSPIMLFRLLIRVSAPRQGQAEGGSLAFRARQRLDAAHVGTYDTLDDRQPQAGSLLASVATFDAVEHIEDTPSFFLWNARPAIRDVDLHLIVLCPSNLHLERHPRRGELRRVLHDVEHSLLDERGVD